MLGRSYSVGEEYRFGFNGQEKNLEINSGSYTTEYRQLDTRIGRWLSTDPKIEMMPDQSPYSFSHNMPIFGSDPKGDVCVPCMYAAGVVIKTGINLGAQAIVNVSIDMYTEGISNYSFNSFKTSLKKVDVFDAVVWSAVPGGNLGLTATKIGSTAAIDMTVGGDKRMLGGRYLGNNNIADKPLVDFFIDGTLNTVAHNVGKAAGNKTSEVMRAPIVESEKALAQAKIQLKPLSLWDNATDALMPYKKVDPWVKKSNKALYSYTENTINTLKTQKEMIPIGEAIIKNGVIGSTMGVANSTAKTATKSLFEDLFNNNKNDNSPTELHPQTVNPRLGENKIQY